MFRNIRLKHKILSKEDCIEILQSQDTAVLSLIGDNGYPYGVPLNYVYQDHHVYLHGAARGHKIDCITNESKACLTIIGQNQTVPHQLSTNYKSVIAFGKVRIIEDEFEKKAVFSKLVAHIAADFIKEGDEAIERLWKTTAAIEFSIEHMSGKFNLEE